MELKELSISWGTLWRILFMGVMAWMLVVAHEVLLGLFLAIVIAAAFDRLVTFFEMKHIPRILSTLVIYILVIFLIGLLVYAVVPLALSELNTFLKTAGKASAGFVSLFNATGILQTISESLGRLTDLLFSGSVSLLQITSRFLGGILFTISVFVLSFYLTLNRDGVPNFLLAVLPAAYEKRAIALYTNIRRRIGRWFNGQIFLSLIVGVAVTIGLSLLNVKYSLILGIIAGILELVPYVGPIVSGALAVVVGLTTSSTLALYILILFIIIQQIESHILVPIVMKMTTALNPVVILVAILLGGKAFGVVGILLAVPAAVLFEELIDNWSEEKNRRKAVAA